MLNDVIVKKIIMNHLFLLHEIVEYLHFQFPRASIGISGSIANNTFKKSSDIDLLFVNETILNAYSISFYYKGISVSIFVFSLNFCLRIIIGYYMDFIICHLHLFYSQILYMIVRKLFLLWNVMFLISYNKERSCDIC